MKYTRHIDKEEYHPEDVQRHLSAPFGTGEASALVSPFQGRYRSV